MSATNPATRKGQILLKKKPTISYEQFCDYWENEHGQLALPWALATGVLYYAQIHRIESSNDPDITVSEWDGAVEFEFDLNAQVHKDATLKAACDAFSRQQVIPDEPRLFVMRNLIANTYLQERSMVRELL
ncbi:hypothetical protein V8C42DRAFT_313933 [Trichoderma barbatum]